MSRYTADPRTWLAGGALLALLLAAVGWFLLIGPERSSTADLRDQVAQSEQQSSVLRGKVATLKAKSAKADQYADAIERAQEALPSDSGMPAFTRQLNADARVAGVSLNGLTVSAVTPVVAGGPASSGSTPAPATPGTTSAAGGLFSLRVTVTTKGSMAGQLAFVRALRNGPRHVLVNGTQFASAGTGKTATIERSSSLNTDVTVFSAPQTPEQVRRVSKLLAALRR